MLLACLHELNMVLIFCLIYLFGLYIIFLSLYIYIYIYIQTHIIYQLIFKYQTNERTMFNFFPINLEKSPSIHY